MKKILTTILAFMALALPMTAQESDGKSTSKSIIISSHTLNDDTNPTVLRAPMHIPVEAWYDAEADTISIIYYGEDEGEVNLYRDGQLIDSSSEISTTFSISESGFYTIEINTDSWTATGSLEI
ncbi:MAG: hypothetical protein K2M83_01495 [Muribaculaceae bacterium]|nr:hypothetical protein [Muribaculaceae bacterium]